MSNQNELTLEGVGDDLENVKTIMFTLARQYERIDKTLDRVALLQEENSRAIAVNQEENSRAIAAMQAESAAYREQTSLAIANLTNQMNQLGVYMIQFSETTRAVQVDIREMQAEVRGLQVENRRILQHVFGDEF
jgi:hypothetical protein